MNEETADCGKRLEELYHRCMERPPEERDAFIRNNAGDPEMARQLRALCRLESPTAANPLIAPSQQNRPYEFKKDDIFANCRIVNEYGHGGMGAVYLARDLKNHNRLVALKVIQPGQLSASQQERFSQETAALSRLVHPNIARLYFSGIETWNDSFQRPYMVMEFIEGSTLGEYLEKNSPTERQIIDMLRKICLAVHYGHLKLVYHRDLKPSNILVNKEGEPKIIDFGVAFTAEPESPRPSDTPSQEFVGTLAYMSPEVAGGRPYKLDARVDVYSLGIIAFEALAGRRPGFQLSGGEVDLAERIDSPAQICQRISQCEREKLRGANRRSGRDLDCVVAKALSLDIEQRYADASQFAEDLRRVMDLEPIKARPPSRLYDGKMFARRNRAAVSLAAAVFAVSVAAAINFRVKELQVGAALVDKSAALDREAAARKIATERGDQILRQSAAAHARAAELAGQRGNWAVAAEEYRAAEEAGFADNAKLFVEELRALDRLGRNADADALIARVETSFPQIAQSSRFLVVKGFYLWPIKPAQSLAAIQTALAFRLQLTPGDRAFAEALTTSDVNEVSTKLREAVEDDPFNHDAYALLALCDLELGDAAQCEQDAGVLQRLFPNDGTGPMLAAVACGFEGRRDAALRYLNAGDIPPNVKSAVQTAVEAVCELHSMDDLRTTSPLLTIRAVNGLYSAASSMESTHPLPVPLTFSKVMGSFGPAEIVALAFNRERLYALAAQWPNGMGELAAGWDDFTHEEFDSASRHFEKVQSSPSLIDCRRTAAMIKTVCDFGRLRKHNWSFEQEKPQIKADLDTLTALGGIYPEKFPEEEVVLRTGISFGLYPEVRVLAMAWLSRTPDDPRAMYFAALSEYKLNHGEIALGLFTRSLAKGLDGELRRDAEAKKKELAPPSGSASETQPS